MTNTRTEKTTAAETAQPAKPAAGNFKWQLGKLSVGGGTILLLLAVLTMFVLGRTAKKDPKAKSAAMMFVLMVTLAILGAVLVLGGLVFLAIGLSTAEKTSKLPIKQYRVSSYEFRAENLTFSGAACCGFNDYPAGLDSPA